MVLRFGSNSVAKKVLLRLSEAPTGELHQSALFDLFSGKKMASPCARLVDLCDRIIHLKMVRVEGEMWSITVLGRRQLAGCDTDAVQTIESVNITSGRWVRPFRPLRLNQRNPLYRAGSWDFALIPSRYGSVRKLYGEVVK